MNNIKFTRLIAIAMSITFALNGCSGFVGAQNNRNQAEYEESIRRQAAMDPARPVINKSNNAYLAGEKISVAGQLSPILKKKVVYKPSRAVVLPDVAHWISDEFNLAVDLTALQVNQSTTAAQGTGGAITNPAAVAGQGAATNGMLLPAPLGGAAPAAGTNPTVGLAQGVGMARSPLQIPMNLKYEGTLNGLLDQLAEKAGVWWKFTDGKAVFFRSETKTFYLPSISRPFEGKSTITTNTSSGSNGSTSGSGSTSASSNTSGADITAKYDVDLWKDIERTAKVVGGSAQVAVNAAAGSITITGSPADVRHMEEWVKSMTDQLSQQIQIDIDTVSYTHLTLPTIYSV